MTARETEKGKGGEIKLVPWEGVPMLFIRPRVGPNNAVKLPISSLPFLFFSTSEHMETQLL